MKKTLFLLSCAAALTLASCSQEKTTDTDTTTAATDGTTTTTTTTTTSTAYSDEAIQQRAERIAAAMAAKMKLDDATREKIRTVYITRGKRLGELQQQYATDTTGRAAAMRSAYTESDTELKSVFTDPTQYSAYEASRTEYMDDNYMDDTNMATSSSSDMSTTGTDNSAMAGGTEGGTMEGGKVKVKADGDVKIKDAEGNKLKVDGDDATIKDKPANGDKTVIK